MPRDLVLGNGRLLVCLDRDLCIRDLYWPYVGLYNHLSGRKVRFGVWAGGQFGWIDETWDRDLRYRPRSLVTECHLRCDRLQISLTVSDAVDHRHDVWARRVWVRNLAPHDRDVRIFLAPDTILCETEIGDTAYFDPFANAVLHYKRDNYLLFGGQGESAGLYGYACGMKGLEGM